MYELLSLIQQYNHTYRYPLTQRYINIILVYYYIITFDLYINNI